MSLIIYLIMSVVSAVIYQYIVNTFNIFKKEGDFLYYVLFGILSIVLAPIFLSGLITLMFILYVVSIVWLSPTAKTKKNK